MAGGAPSWGDEAISTRGGARGGATVKEGVTGLQECVDLPCLLLWRQNLSGRAFQAFESDWSQAIYHSEG
jgi:hypothetical protein